MENHLVVQLKSEELFNKIRQIVSCQLEKTELDKNIKEELFTRKQTAKFFDVAISTIHRWKKEGKINSYGIGGREYYRKEELLQSLIKTN